MQSDHTPLMTPIDTCIRVYMYMFVHVSVTSVLTSSVVWILILGTIL